MNILQSHGMGECLVCELYMNKAVTMYLKFERGRYCPKKRKATESIRSILAFFFLAHVLKKVVREAFS